MNILQMLFGKPREYNNHGAETRDGKKYRYRTNLRTSEIEAYTQGEDGWIDSMTYAPKDTKLADLRRSVAGNGDAWKQVNTRSRK